MSFPKSETELAGQGYKFLDFRLCRGCGVYVRWYAIPKGKFIPLEKDKVESHFANCPKAEEFRKK